MVIREERRRDRTAIARVVELAFGRADEARLVDQLRADGDAALSLVAIKDDAIVGHVLLSPMSAPRRALGLAPLSVLPGHWKQGIGAALIEAVARWAKEHGWMAIFVVGDPAYYQRFGFRHDLASAFSSPYAGPHLMVRPLDGVLPATSGRIDYAPAFGGQP